LEFLEELFKGVLSEKLFSGIEELREPPLEDFRKCQDTSRLAGGVARGIFDTTFFIRPSFHLFSNAKKGGQILAQPHFG